jgi:hypothetical protein
MSVEAYSFDIGYSYPYRRNFVLGHLTSVRTVPILLLLSLVEGCRQDAFYRYQRRCRDVSALFTRESLKSLVLIADLPESYRY